MPHKSPNKYINTHRLKKDWRSQYIRILDKGPKVGLLPNTPEHDLEKSFLRDLEDMDFIRITFTSDSWIWNGTTITGRIMSDVFKDDSPWGKFTNFLKYFFIWLSGIVSALIIKWIAS